MTIEQDDNKINRIWKVYIETLDDNEYYLQDKSTRDDLVLTGSFDDCCETLDNICIEEENRTGDVIMRTTLESHGVCL